MKSNCIFSKMSPQLKKGIIAFLLSTVSAPALVMRLGNEDLLDGQGLIVFLLWLMLLAVYYKLLFNKSRKFKSENLFSGFVAVAFLFGDACVLSEGLSPIWSSPWQIIKSMLLLVVYFFLVRTAARLFYEFSERHLSSFKLPDKLLKHPVLFFAGLIFIFWLPQIIIKFPGTMCYDNVTQLSQCFGYTDYASNHPMTHTLYLGLCWKFGMLFDSPNLGLFTAIFLQSVLMIFIFAYTITQMIRLKVPKWVVVIAFIVYAVTPNIVGYISIPLKDIPYSAFYVLYTSMLVDLLWDDEAFWKTKRKVAALILSGAMIVLLRNNGLIAVIPISAILVIRMLKSKRAFKQRMKAICAIAMTFVITISVNGAINLAYSPEGGSMGEPLSFFFQQTARTLRDYPEDVTREEAEAIDRVLDYENLGELYDARISDPVKSTWKSDATLSDLFSYLAVWAKMGIRHPITYLEATVSQNYSLFYPQVNNIKYYPSVKTHHPLNNEMPETAGLHGISALTALRDGMTRYYKVLHNTPLIGTVSNIGFCVLLMLLLMTLSRHNNICGIGIIFMPSFLTLIMCIFSPVIMLQSRYAFPIVYSIPIMLAAYVAFRHRQKTV